MSLPELSIRRPVFMTMVLVLLVLLGIVSYQKMDVNEMPDASYPFVSVSVTYDGAQPEQIDEQVVRKIEEAVSEAKGVRHITSTSTEGSADVGIEFKIGIDPAEAAQDVRDKVSAVRGDLPDGVKEPVISRFDMNAAPVAAIALTTEDGDLRELSAFVNDTLKPQLQKVAGIGQIQVSGNTKREVELLLSQDKLNEYGLAISDVAASLKAVNQDIPAGNFDNSGRQTAVRTAGAFRSLNDVYRAELATRGAQPILFEQVVRKIEEAVSEAKGVRHRRARRGRRQENARPAEGRPACRRLRPPRARRCCAHHAVHGRCLGRPDSRRLLCRRHRVLVPRRLAQHRYQRARDPDIDRSGVHVHAPRPFQHQHDEPPRPVALRRPAHRRCHRRRREHHPPSPDGERCKNGGARWHEGNRAARHGDDVFCRGGLFARRHDVGRRRPVFQGIWLDGRVRRAAVAPRVVYADADDGGAVPARRKTGDANVFETAVAAVPNRVHGAGSMVSRRAAPHLGA